MTVTPFACALAITTLLAACVTPTSEPTGYLAAGTATSGNSFGYSDKRLSNDEYSIVVTGNPQTGEQRVRDIALLRAAHIAEEQHRTHFVILNQSTERAAGKTPLYAPIPGLPVWAPVGQGHTKTPRAVLVIRLLPVDAALTEKALRASDIISEAGKRIA